VDAVQHVPVLPTSQQTWLHRANVETMLKKRRTLKRR
jgi:hypothetical protein